MSYGHEHGHGPPVWIDKHGNLTLFWTSLIFAAIESSVGFFLTDSSYVKADAADACIHSLWYGSPVFINWAMSRSWLSGRLKFNLPKWAHNFNIIFFYASLIWILQGAVSRWWFQEPVKNVLFMLVGGMIGLLGNVLCFLIVRRIILRVGGKFYKVFWWHALIDMSISLGVVILASILRIAPGVLVLSANLRLLYSLDPIFSITVVLWAFWLSHRFFSKNS